MIDSELKKFNKRCILTDCQECGLLMSNLTRLEIIHFCFTLQKKTVFNFFFHQTLLRFTLKIIKREKSLNDITVENDFLTSADV